MIDPRMDPQDARYDPWAVVAGRLSGGGIITGLGLFLMIVGFGIDEMWAAWVGIAILIVGVGFLAWGYSLHRRLPPKPRKEKTPQVASPKPDIETLRAATAFITKPDRRSTLGEPCSLCGSTEGVAQYGVYRPHFEYGSQGISAVSWNVDAQGFDAAHYCDRCVQASRSVNVRHAAMVFFMPTLGIYRLWKFTTCSPEEMGDLMVASARQGRDPLKKHILWPYGDSTHGSLNTMTRETAQKRLVKKHTR